MEDNKVAKERGGGCKITLYMSDIGKKYKKKGIENKGAEENDRKGKDNYDNIMIMVVAEIGGKWRMEKQGYVALQIFVSCFGFIST